MRKLFLKAILFAALALCLPGISSAQSVLGIPAGYPVTGDGISGYQFTNGAGIIIGSGFGTTASLNAGFTSFAFQISATGTGQSTTLAIGWSNPSRTGYSCFASDITTSAKNPIWVSAMSPSQTTFTATAAPAAGDLININCFAF